MSIFDRTADDLPFVRPEDVPKETIRAVLACSRHGASKWRMVAVVDADTIYTHVENASLTDASHLIEGVCKHCPPPMARFGIDAKKVRERLRKTRRRGRISIDEVAERKAV